MRTYTDPQGTVWTVYLVAPGGGTSPQLLPPEFRAGWLCYECEEGKRRLAPIPADWESCPENRLDAYRASAVSVQRRIVATSDGRNAPARPVSEELRDVEHFFTRKLPSSLSLALDKVAEHLAQPDAPAETRPALPHLRLASQAASAGDFATARDRYRDAAAYFPRALLGG